MTIINATWAYSSIASKKINNYPLTFYIGSLFPRKYRSFSYKLIVKSLHYFKILRFFYNLAVTKLKQEETLAL